MNATSALPDVTPTKPKPGSSGGARKPVHVLRQWADHLIAYVPLALVGILAAMTFWLLRLTPVPQEAQAARPTPTVPDNYLVNFVARSFDNSGTLTAQVIGDSAQHLPHTGDMHVQVARITAWGKDDTRTDSTSDAAVVNQAQTQYELNGNVVVKRIQPNKPDLQITGEQLLVDTDLDRMTSVLPVHVRRGVDDIKSQRMVVDNATGIAEFSERVRAVVQPRP